MPPLAAPHAGDVGDVVAAQADREAEQGAEHRAGGCAAGCLRRRRSLVGEVLAVGDVVLVVAAADAGVDEWAVLRRGAAAAEQGDEQRGGEGRLH